MNRKLTSLILVLALAFTVPTFAIAADSATGTTDGSIEFESGGFIVNPPGETDDNYPPDPEDPDPKDPNPDDPDPDNQYNNFFFFNEVEDNLYFGKHDLSVHGIFDSANTEQTTSRGKYTGVEVINNTMTNCKVSVSISVFMVDSEPTLEGAELTLVKKATLASGTTGTAFVQTKTSVPLLTPDASYEILTVLSARAVKAAWSGSLLTLPGTNAPGEAQADLTWTTSVTP